MCLSRCGESRLSPARSSPTTRRPVARWPPAELRVPARNGGALEPRLPRLLALRDRVAARPRIAAYLASPRRLAFNQQGIFRRYPELDAGPRAGRPGR